MQSEIKETLDMGNSTELVCYNNIDVNYAKLYFVKYNVNRTPS